MRGLKKESKSVEKQTCTTSETPPVSNSKPEVLCDEKVHDKNRAFVLPDLPIKRNELTMSSFNQSYDLIFEDCKRPKPEGLATPIRAPKTNKIIDQELKEAEERRINFLNSIKRKALEDLINVDKVLKSREESKSKAIANRKDLLETKIKNSQILRERVLQEVTERARFFNSAVDNFSPKSVSKTLNCSFESAQIARQELMNKRQEKLSKHWEHVLEVKNSAKAQQGCEEKEN